LKRAKIEAITMQSRVRRRRDRAPAADTESRQASGPNPLSLVDQARSFYRQRRAEVIERMRHPSAPTHNPAAVVVLICETDSELRDEAYAAQQAALHARQRSATFVETLHHYLPNADHQSRRAPNPLTSRIRT
jgi:hypothetical protein